MKLHLSAYNPPIATPSDVNIGLQCVRLPKCCPQELNVHFIVETRMSFIVGELSIQLYD